MGGGVLLHFGLSTLLSRIYNGGVNRLRWLPSTPGTLS
jgi:hypothetical protein